MKKLRGILIGLMVTLTIFSCKQSSGLDDIVKKVSAKIVKSGSQIIGDGTDKTIAERFEIQLSNAKLYNVKRDKDGNVLAIDGSDGTEYIIDSVSVDEWFSPQIEGLDYTFAGVPNNNNDAISIEVKGTAKRTSAEKITINVPTVLITPNEGVPAITEEHVEVTGLRYNTKYEGPEATLTATDGKGMTIDGNTSSSINRSFKITITKGTYKGTLADTEISFISPKVEGLSYKGNGSGAEIAISITGTPTEGSASSITLTNISVNDKLGEEMDIPIVANNFRYDIKNYNEAPSAKDSTSVVSGKVGQAIDSTIVVQLNTGYFVSMGKDTDVSSWVAGGKVESLSYKLKNFVPPFATSLSISVTGTISTEQTGAITLKIPGSCFTVTTNSVNVSGAKYNITTKAYDKSDIPLITVNGKDDYSTEYKGSTLKVNVPKQGDLYLVITNPTTEELTAPTLSGYHVPATNNNLLLQYNNLNSVISSQDNQQYALVDYVQEYHPEPLPTLEGLQQTQSVGGQSKATNTKWTSPYKDLNVGAKKTIYESNGNGVPSTLRYKKTINTTNKNGNYTKTLFIFVADNMWGDQGAGIDQNFVDSQAAGFLKEGEMNDIYDIVTSIYGQEWGNTWDLIPAGYQNMYQTSPNYNPYSENGNEIGETNEIVIAFIDINKSGSTTSGTGGYVFTGNNQINYSGTSNEAVCLVMDARISQHDPSGSLTTMAHEFQHAIHHFQRDTKKAWTTTGQTYAASVTWVNETFATLAEDAVADYLKVQGPGNNDTTTGGSASDGRSLVNGRNVHFFNAQRYDITRWNDIRGDAYVYGIGWSLGSYLTRTYGSAIIENYMKSTDIERTFDVRDSNASSANNKAHLMIAKAASDASGSTVTWEDILKGWGASVLLSDKENTKIPYKVTNRNANGTYWWNDTYSKYGLKVPSINYWSYIIQQTNKYGMWNGGGYNLPTTGPYVFNQSADRNYTNVRGKTFMGNTNTFVLLDKNATAGEHTYSLSGNSGYKYQVVLK